MGMAQTLALLTNQLPMFPITVAAVDMEFPLRKRANQLARHVIASGIVGMDHNFSILPHSADQLRLGSDHLHCPTGFRMFMCFLSTQQFIRLCNRGNNQRVSSGEHNDNRQTAQNHRPAPVLLSGCQIILHPHCQVPPHAPLPSFHKGSNHDC